jgi:hypothetical protein
MPVNIWNVPWLNQNSQRNYPLSEEASLLDVSGTFKIPLDLIVDLVWPVQAASEVQADRFYIYSITMFGTGLTITMGYMYPPSIGNGGVDTPAAIGSVSVSLADHQRNQSYFIHGVGDFYDSVGKITIGDLDNVEHLGGNYKFDLSGSRLEPTVIRPNLRGISAIVLVNGNDRSEPITGDVEFITGQNADLQVSTSSITGNKQIRFSAINGLELNDTCDCANLPTTAQPIKTINGIAADQLTRDFKLIGDDCLTLEPVEGGLRIVDKCSKSCCGCEELSKILTDLEQMNIQINSMDGLYQQLSAAVTTATTALLASKTNELPCEE